MNRCPNCNQPDQERSCFCEICGFVLGMPGFVGRSKPKKFSLDRERILNDPKRASIDSMVSHMKWAEQHDPMYTKREGDFWKKELKPEMDKAGIVL